MVTTFQSMRFPKFHGLFPQSKQRLSDILFNAIVNSHCFKLIENRPGKHCAFSIQHLMHCGCRYLSDNSICVIGSLTVRRNCFQLPRLFTDHFGIPWFFQVSGHPVC